MPFDTYQDPTSMALLSGSSQRQASSQDAASAALAQGNVQRQALRVMERSKDRDRELQGYLARLETSAKSHFQRADHLHEQALQTGKIEFMQEALAAETEGFNRIQDLNAEKVRLSSAFAFEEMRGNQDITRKTIQSFRDILEKNSARQERLDALAAAEKAVTDVNEGAKDELVEDTEPRTVGEEASEILTGAPVKVSRERMMDIIKRMAKAESEGRSLEEVGVSLAEGQVALDTLTAILKPEAQGASTKAFLRESTSLGATGILGDVLSAIGMPGMGAFGALFPETAGGIMQTWLKEREPRALLAQKASNRAARLRSTFYPGFDADVAAESVAGRIVGAHDAGQDPTGVIREDHNAFTDNLYTDPKSGATARGYGDLFGRMPPPIVQAGEPGSPVTSSAPGAPDSTGGLMGPGRDVEILGQ